MPSPELLAHWWNRSWGTMTRKDVWVEQLPDGRYQVRWRGGRWRDRDGVCWRSSRDDAWTAVKGLLEDGSDWKRM